MLYFDEATHTYIYEDRQLRSVSSVVASQFKRFNAYAVSKNLELRKSKDPDSEYFGMTQQEIIQKWADSGKESRDMGTSLHRQIEDFYQKGVSPPDSPEWRQFMAFVNDHPGWVCIGNEVKVHNGKIAGTIDAIFDTPEGLVLVDWKRCKAIDFCGYGMGRDMMKHVADCNFSKYSLQLSLYRMLMRVQVSACFIVNIHPNQESYQQIAAQDFMTEAKMISAALGERD